MGQLVNSQIDGLLKGTSRSFYLTLKALPKRIRSQVGVLYLLARTSDTIADSHAGEPATRLALLADYNSHVQGRSDSLPDLTELAAVQSDAAEKELLEQVSASVASLVRFSDSDQNRIKTCLDIIISGQSLDLEKFTKSDSRELMALANESELDDYAYRVAGSVGEFWTHLTIDHLISADAETQSRLFADGVRFGKALQMINILRDIPADLALGRCYIPSDTLAAHGLKPSDLEDPKNMQQFRPLFDHYIDIAAGHLAAAVDYIALLPHNQYRLRAACTLPVLIGQRTLQLLREGNVLDGESRIKVGRPEIKKMRRKTVFAILSKKRSANLLNKNRNI